MQEGWLSELPNGEVPNVTSGAEAQGHEPKHKQ